MLLKDVMTRGVEVVDPEASLREAARKMKELDVGPMPVCDGQRLVGVLTDRDLAVRAIAEGLDPVITRVREVMTPGVTYCFDDQGLEEALAIMEQQQLRRLLVLDRNKRLVGIVSLGDVALRGGDGKRSGEVLKEVSEPPTSAPVRQKSRR